jgi:leader peptidase (prepilin peptidase) / N-methyltransferase
MNLYSVFVTNPEFFYTVAALTGLLVGSFLNVVIYRLPIMMEREWRAECNQFLGIKTADNPEPGFNLVVPGSACPHCQHKIRPIENIPVLSYLILGVKCSNCKQTISLRYPLIEAVTAILTLVVAIHFGVSMQALLAILLTWSLIALTAIDYDHQLLPDSITLPVLWIGILCNMSGLYTDVYSSLYGTIAGYMALWSVYIAFKLATGKEGMGHGDFKLLAMLGAWLGWQALPVIILVSSLLGSVVGIGLILFGGHKKSQPIPFGPYLALAGWISLLYGNDLIRLYYRYMVN